MRIQRVETSADSQVWQHIPENDVERQLTLVERELLNVVLAQQVHGYPALAEQIAHAMCRSRTYDNHGAVIDYDVPAHLPKFDNPGGPIGHGDVGWHVDPPGKEDPYVLGAFTFFRDGRLLAMELRPLGMAPWSLEECHAILTAPREAVWFYPPRVP